MTLTLTDEKQIHHSQDFLTINRLSQNSSDTETLLQSLFCTSQPLFKITVDSYDFKHWPKAQSPHSSWYEKAGQAQYVVVLILKKTRYMCRGGDSVQMSLPPLSLRHHS